MSKEFIEITGARQHNLRNLTLEIPREKLVVITGMSGSGQVVAGLRHPIRGRAAARLRGKSQRVCPAVPRPDAEAGCGFH